MSCFVLAAAAVAMAYFGYCVNEKEMPAMAFGCFLLALLFAGGAVNAAAGC